MTPDTPVGGAVPVPLVQLTPEPPVVWPEPVLVGAVDTCSGCWVGARVVVAHSEDLAALGAVGIMFKKSRDLPESVTAVGSTSGISQDLAALVAAGSDHTLQIRDKQDLN